MSEIHKVDSDCYVHSMYAKGIDLSFNQYITSAEDGDLLPRECCEDRIKFLFSECGHKALESI